MKWLFLLASIGSAIMVLLFIYTLIFYFQHYQPTWRVLALLVLVAAWIGFTRDAFMRFKHYSN